MSNPGFSQRQAGAFASPPARSQQSGGGYVKTSFVLLVVVVLIIGVVFFVLPRLTTSQQTSSSTGSTQPGVPATTAALPSNGIGVSMVNGEQIGISDGSYALDTSRSDGQDKVNASKAFASKDIATAQSLWHAALAKESNDAEPLIYLENQRVLNSGHPYVTVVIAIMLTGQATDIGTGRDSLQGAYVLQKEFNANNGAAQGGTMMRLLIASSGSSSTNTSTIAQQIVQAAKTDSTIIGVMGWPYSSQSVNAINVLNTAKIPMVSSTASSDQLSGISPYFFRVAPPDTSQAKVGAQYAKQKLNATNVVVFQDQSDAYSQSLASGFTQQFQAAGGKVIGESYTKGNANSIRSALQNALSQTPAPDLIYFAGYANDVSIILEELPKNSNFPNLQVLGGDALYNLGGYPQSAQAGFSRLHFTDFAYPDEWSILGYGSKQPTFFTDYANAFDPNRTHQGSPYGFTRATYNVILSYDATLALSTAVKNAIAGGKKTPTPVDIQQALSNINGARAIQGASGQIAFDPQTGDPVNKAVVILYVDSGGHIQMDSQLGAGQFLIQQ
ncbi:MAG TPA: ABC transporter substrate-binding protein, partial [Ktedonobacteraceae bacterium]|nr:ABC transporter substrate-binding protein [Ktedonobacteraceae bacterium]